MQVPGHLLTESVEQEIVRRSGLPVKRIPVKEGEDAVLSQEQWGLLHEIIERGDVSESASTVLLAYSRVIQLHSQVRSAEGRMAEVAAVMAIYNADRSVGQRLSYLLR